MKRRTSVLAGVVIALGWVVAAVVTTGCGGGGGSDEGGEGGSDAAADAVSDGADGEGGEGGEALPVRASCGAPEIEVEASQEQVPSSGQAVHYTRFIPAGCTKETPCPALFLAPDGLMGGDEFFGTALPKLLAARTGAIVIWFNPPGRGIGAQLSGGVEDYNGMLGQDALKSVFNSATKRQDTTDELGLISFGTGLSLAAPALSRHGATTMADADFLIDVEGPVNRCGITALPFDPEAGITDDGPAADGTKCDFQHAPREDAFPTSGELPASVLCSLSSPIIAATEKDCSDDLWWRAREPNQFISKLEVDYLRVQMKYDHALATRWASLLAIYYAVQGGDISYKQLNNVKANTPLLAVGDESCEEDGCYLELDQGNAIAFPSCAGFNCSEPLNAYHQADPEYRPMDLETFFTCVLPVFAKRMLDRQ